MYDGVPHFLVDVRHVETIAKSLREIGILEHKGKCTNACCHAFDFYSVTANKNKKNCGIASR